MIATLFVNPILIPASHVMWWILPLTAGVAVVYRTLRCEDIRLVWKESAILFIKIIIGMALLVAGFWAFHQALL